MLESQKIERRTPSVAGVKRAALASDLLFHGKWKLQVLWVMRSGPVRLGQLARRIPGASKKVLTQNLRELEAGGVIIRTDLSDVVLHVEYALNPDLHEAVCNLLGQLGDWGDRYIRWTNIQNEREGCGSPD